jgi:hypothetical protein
LQFLSEFNDSFGNFTEIKIDFRSSEFTSNDFRDAIWSLLQAREFVDLGIIGFGEGLQIPRNFCPLNAFGKSCSACGACNLNLVCDSGSMGTGECKCPRVFMKYEFNYSYQIPGRCISYSLDRLDGGILANEKAEISNRTIVVVNVGKTVERITGAVVQNDEQFQSGQVNFFSILSQHNWSISLQPGESIRFMIGFQLDLPINVTGNLLIFVDNFDDSWKDDAALAIPLQVQGTYFGKRAENGFLSGNFNLYRVSVGSNFGGSWNGSFFESDTWGQPVITKRINNSASAPDAPSIFQTLMQMTNSTTPHYRSPIRFPGMVTLNLLFFDSESTGPSQRVFEVYANNISISSSPIDIFNISGGKDRVVVLQMNINFNFDPKNHSSTAELCIRFIPRIGTPILSAIEIFQEMNLSLLQYAKMNDVFVNYAEALHLTFLFFDQLRSGNYTNRRIAWRNRSCFECYGPEGQDLTGGYYEAGGNYLKLNFPMAWTLANVGLGLIEHWKGYNRSGQISFALDTLKHGYDYLMNCRLDSDRIALSIGDRRFDFPYSGPPEFYSSYIKSRPIWIIDAKTPGKSSEICGEAAASLAIGSMVFKEIDYSYSRKLLSEVIEYYNFGKRFEASYSDFKKLNNGFNDMAYLYRSTSYLDEMAWGAALLYRSTGNQSFLDDARSYYMRY